MAQQLPVQRIDDGVVVRLKVVPGASRSRIVGALGDRLKVQVAAPPEGGKANKAVIDLLAETLGVAVRDVTITTGHSQAMKTARVRGVNVAEARQAMGI